MADRSQLGAESVTHVASELSGDLLQLRGVTKHFTLGRSTVLRAVDGVDLTVGTGRTMALVGESGSGKSTLGRVVVRLTEPTAGEVNFDGQDISHLRHKQLREVRQQLQMVFQSPMTSLSPRISVGRSLEEPLTIHTEVDRHTRRSKVADALEMVGLPRAAQDRLPEELSGGQRQRVAIARALMLQPRLVVADEPTASLDLTTQAQIVNLLLRLQEELHVGYLFITHDLGLAKHLSHDCAVLYLGRIVEIGPTADLMDRPLHPYTNALVSARARERISVALPGETPSPINPPSGCHFRTRCPIAVPLCAAEYPPLKMAAAGHSVACHRAGELELAVSKSHPLGVGQWPQPIDVGSPSISTPAVLSRRVPAPPIQEES